MSDSTRYFQLTKDILVEYNYNDLSSASNQSGNANHIIDLGNSANIINNGYNSTRTFLWSPLEERFVLPINKSESKFIKCLSNHGVKIWNQSSDFSATSFSESSGNIDMYDDVLRDTFRLHFTSRNFFGDYDGLILSVTLYDKNKNKIGLLSQYIKRTDDPDINQNPVLINQKLYTSYKDFTIPNVNAIINYDILKNKLPGEEVLYRKLFKYYNPLENTPVVMNIYGVKSTYVNNNYEYYNVEKINSIYIPLEDNSNKFHIEIEESKEGDYFEIYPKVDHNRISFSDYIYNISDGRPETYIVFYELTLIEHYVDYNNVQKDKVTHREQYIINAAQQILDNGDTVLEINESELDNIMYYRPILLYANKDVSYTIDVKANIINTLDNTTIIKKSSRTFTDSKKYGKRLNKIYLGSIPAQVNVYNKKPDIDTDLVKITNASSNVKIENHQHSIIGFIECANVGVSIEQIQKEDLI